MTFLGADGCSLDADSDGVLDYLDSCLQTKAGVTVNWVGCEPDTDKDGILDVDDKCADSAGTDAVNSDGCNLMQSCPCTRSPPWEGHSEYFQCVVQHARRLLDEQQISASASGLLIRKNANSRCGRNKGN